MGKSALLAAAAGRAQAAGLLVLHGRAAEHERECRSASRSPRWTTTCARCRAAGRPAGSRARCGAPRRRGARGARGGPIAGPAERYRCHRALTAMLELVARERPMALLLDDVHRADAASLEWVLHLLRRPPRAACLVLLATRPGGPAPRLREALRARASSSRSSRCPATDSLAVPADLPDVALRERIASAAGGNPLFLRELARGAAPRGRAAADAGGRAAARVGAAGARVPSAAGGRGRRGDPFDAGWPPRPQASRAEEALAALDGEVDRPHVAVVLLERGHDAGQLVVRLLVDLLHVGERRRVADAATTSSPWAFWR